MKVYFFCFFVGFFGILLIWHNVLMDGSRGTTYMSDAEINAGGLFFAFFFGGVGLLFARAIVGSKTGSEPRNTTAKTVAIVGAAAVHQRNKHNRELEEVNEKLDEMSGEEIDPGGFDPSEGGFF